ncbi:FAD-binding oxidoreductase [Sulfitobacter mediterraneus]|uniref:NAD(P)/FAD-dependent oxidoreductase n=1 Tax=Sulfitobacter mediterraneus TaxID=83219 RepID=UPI001933B941|nr:FAD-binding oxidoreductase [Sulfitobacter mediterraneus]MBM1311380.1 FAD-binding oxidoreductase [Sulfitobacter mediterraneus]MBM1315262.1 FAD-binding oxidoreductase [Sulfitobacter mediterraneus]MBM1323623.1 FAD-binding oxidoreductase [Sulfitobacter mediterraneus]MBM1327535.1 FAD-binding oxidoreductase [Sulfitobacter mediterraneus]MBM1398883.1 FAD-binding oxidoreductase [Sulfitobacter mediterraneus]
MSDIVVIGGGIAGLSAAARLSEHFSVTVLEREQATGYHASGRSAAMFEQNYGLPSTVALNKASAQYHREANGGYLSPRGLMIIAAREDAEAFDDDVVTMGIERISKDRAVELVPILDPAKFTFAGYHEAGYDIDTDRLMQDFIRQIRSNGGAIVTKAEVTAITRQTDGWQVVAGGQTYDAAKLVNAAGAWADAVAQAAGIAPIGITPRRRSMARIPAPEDRDLRHWPMFFGVGESWYAKPDAGALLVSPADEDVVAPQDAWADDMVLAEGLARYEGMVRTPVTRLLASWAGLRSFAPDKALVLGPDPNEPDFIWCAGQGGYGFQTAPAASQLLADLVRGVTPALPEDLVAQLLPDRLRT